jgi:hypothetical protein
MNKALQLMIRQLAILLVVAGTIFLFLKIRNVIHTDRPPEAARRIFIS